MSLFYYLSFVCLFVCFFPFNKDLTHFGLFPKLLRSLEILSILSIMGGFRERTAMTGDEIVFKGLSHMLAVVLSSF